MSSRPKILWILLLILSAIPLSAQKTPPQPVWAYQIEAINRDVREVLDDLFQKAGKQYVVEPSVQGTVTLRIATNSFEEALRRVLQSAGLVYQIERSQSGRGRMVETYVVRSASYVPMPPFSEVLSRPVNLIASAKLRTVLNMLAQQVQVPIVASKEVPDLEVTRLVLNNVTLGYALNAIAQATQTQYQFLPDGSIQLTPAPSVQVKPESGATAPRKFVDPTIVRPMTVPLPPAGASKSPILKCRCGAELQAHWNFCPMCGKRIDKPQPASPRR